MRIDKRVVGAFALGLLGPLALLWGASAGDLEPPGPPSSTMKDLDRIAPVWSETLPADDGDGTCNSSRFRCVFDGEAVLDMETGLVWERAPLVELFSWNASANLCYAKKLGFRMGWRLPTVEDLASIQDQEQMSAPYLPPGHPFQNVQAGIGDAYWTRTSLAAETTQAYYVNFNFGSVSYGPKTEDHYRWCVRGGSGHDGY